MEQFASLVLVLLLTGYMPRVAESGDEGLKCTPEDPRPIYPHCMLSSEDLSLWCDQSNYTKLPSVDQINKHLPTNESSCAIATSLYVNDSCITELERDDLLGFEKITIFCAHGNKISQLTGRTFEGNPGLVKINLGMNEITMIHATAFKGLRNLLTLNLESNSISSIEPRAFADLRSLQTLVLDNNHLQVLNDGFLRRLVSLRVLSITGNKISYMEDNVFRGLSKLTHLHLDGNNLKRISMHHFKNLRSLQVLTISHNLIETWPEGYGAVFTNLHTFDLGHNRISEFKSTHVRNMSKLQNLSLENNSLKSIEEDSFHPTPSLVYLNLGENYIEDIPTNAFKDLCHLKHIILKSNNIKTPRLEWFQRLIERENDGTETDVTGNKWECDCDVYVYLKFLKKLKDEAAESPGWSSVLDIECYSPKQFGGDRLSDIYEYQFQDMECEGARVLTTKTDAKTNPENCTTAKTLPETETLQQYQPKPHVPLPPQAVASVSDEDKSEKGIAPVAFWGVIAGSCSFCIILLIAVLIACRYYTPVRKAKRRSKERKSESAEPCIGDADIGASNSREDVFVVP